MLLIFISRFTNRHWEDLAESLFSFLVVPTEFCTNNVPDDCTNMGACSNSTLKKTIDCDVCQLFTSRIGLLIGWHLEETVGEN